MSFKNYILSLIILGISFSAYSQKSTVTKDELPNEIQSYVKEHFTTQTIVQSVREKEGKKIEYDLILDNGVKLEFKNNRIKEIKSKTKLVDSVIPDEILSYVHLNFPNNSIISWELKKNKQEVELDNGLDLEFTKDGKFLRID